MDFAYTDPSFPSLNGYPSQFLNTGIQVQRQSVAPIQFGTGELDNAYFAFYNNGYMPTLPYMADRAGGVVWGGIHYSHKPHDDNSTSPYHPQLGFTARNHISHEFIQGTSTRNEPLSAVESSGPKRKKRKTTKTPGIVHKTNHSEVTDEHGKTTYLCKWNGLDCKLEYSCDRISEMQRHHRGTIHAAEKLFCCSKYACPCGEKKMFSRNDTTRRHAIHYYAAVGRTLPPSLARQRRKSRGTGNIYAATVQEEDTP